VLSRPNRILIVVPLQLESTLQLQGAAEAQGRLGGKDGPDWTRLDQSFGHPERMISMVQEKNQENMVNDG